MDHVLSRVRDDLENIADEKTRESSNHFFKEPVNSYGVKMAAVSKISKEYFKVIRNQPKTKIFDLCEELWASGYMEECIIACNWSYYLHKEYVAEDFKIFETWVNLYVSNWATCDTLCNHTIGEFVMMYPEYMVSLKQFAESENRWMRRASAVSLIIPARKGKFLKDILEIADILLLDNDDMVQKGYGWMLKAASQSHLQEIFDYVVRKKNIMPRTALRYAIEKMPEELKARAMER
jgi:3-methyladenine DNA glycosylase AlkD